MALGKPRDWKPAILAGILVELDARLHHVLSHGGPSPCIPPEFPRIAIALRLLDQATGTSLETGIPELRAAFRNLSTTLGDVPERNPAYLAPAWTALAGHLESLLDGLDQGGDPAASLSSPDWDLIIQRFEVAGTALEGLLDLQEIMNSWALAWGDSELDAQVEEDLTKAWDRLRAYGDSLFRPGLLGRMPPGK